MQPIAGLWAKKATQRMARDRAITDRRELCRTSFIQTAGIQPMKKICPRFLHKRRSFSDFWEEQAARSASLGWTAISQSSVDSKQMDRCYRACSRRGWRELLSRYSLPTSCVPGFMKNLYLLICTVPSFASQQACGLRDFFSKDVSSRPGCINRVLPSTLSWASREERNGSS